MDHGLRLTLLLALFQWSCQHPPAPAEYQVIIATGPDGSGGHPCPVVINVTRHLAPHGADRFYHAAYEGHFADSAIYRVESQQVVEFGISGRPELNTAMEQHHLGMVHDDRANGTNSKGSVAFAKMAGTTSLMRLVINLEDNPAYDELGVAPFGRVVSGMSTLQGLRAPSLRGYEPVNIAHMYRTFGNDWIKHKDPDIGMIANVSVVYAGIPPRPHPPVCGTAEENGFMLTIKHTIELAEEYAGKSAPLALWIIVFLAATAWGVYAFHRLLAFLRKHRMLAYSRPFEASADEMIYDDTVASGSSRDVNGLESSPPVLC